MLIIAGLMTACSAQATAPVTDSSSGVPVSVEGGAYTNITPAQLADLLKSKDFFFANTHIPYEGEIEQTDGFIPYDEITQRLSELPADKNAKIVLYCRSGRMSAIAAEALVKGGYTDVWNLDGGMIAWEEAGFSLKGE
ncbi:MAG TPA: rhodanese-like domain-containing protein [Anaerolineae bacterium]|nr:rhodanese-like domain-containing protein [Anaerolineae bacterium]